jgi:hypothetical protein
MIAAVLWFLVGSAAALPTDAEMNKAAEPWQQCLQATADRLDDGHSDFNALGKLVTQTCHPIFEQMEETLTKDMGPDDKKRLRDGLIYVEVGSGNVAIMRHRQGQQPMTPPP